MRKHDARQPLLLHAREAGHVGVLDDVRAVFVIAGVRDLEPDLVQPRRPRENVARFFGIERPRFRNLVEDPPGGAFDARRLLVVYAVVIAQPTDRPIADVFMADAAEQIVEQAFTQRAGRR